MRMASTGLAFLLLLSFLPTPSNAAGCDCLASLPGQAVGDDITVRVPTGVSTLVFNYGNSYGLHSCSAHDMEKPPFCVESTPQGAAEENVIPAWCRKHWCYVDNSTCASAVPSSYISGTYCTCCPLSSLAPHGPSGFNIARHCAPSLADSYEACGDVNVFLDFLSSMGGTLQLCSVFSAKSLELLESVDT